MQSRAATVEAYLAELPADRREAVQRIREVFLANIDPLLREGMQYGMIGYFIPHEVYPPGYHCDPRQPVPYAAIASQKQHLAVYLCAMYLREGDPEPCDRMRARFLSASPKLDLGKSCIRFKRLEEFPLDALAQAIHDIDGASYLRRYQAVLASRPGTKPGAKAPSRTKGPAKPRVPGTRPRKSSKPAKANASKPGARLKKKTTKTKPTARTAGARAAGRSRSPPSPRTPNRRAR